MEVRQIEEASDRGRLGHAQRGRKEAVKPKVPEPEDVIQSAIKS